MSRLRLAALAVSAAAALAAPASASIIPAPGHYEGSDRNHHHIDFWYSRATGITRFTIAFENFPDAQVQGAQWHHTCRHGLCTRGQWTAAHHVSGIWNDSHQGWEAHFNAIWVEGLHQP